MLVKRRNLINLSIDNTRTVEENNPQAESPFLGTQTFDTGVNQVDVKASLEVTSKAYSLH